MTGQPEEFLQCTQCAAKFGIKEVRYHCDCGALLSIERTVPWRLPIQELKNRALSPSPLDQSGVWRYREAVLTLPPEHVITHPEGGTRLYFRQALADYGGVATLHFKHEGENPTGSFKDRGMTVAVSQARHLGLTTVACASTGNTSASLAAYAAQAGMKALVFIPAGKVAVGKLAQSLGYGAQCLAVRGDFDAALRLVQEAASHLGIYLVNSLNPFRLEGQKTIIFELLEARGWQVPDWLVVPAGNLGNTSAFGKALKEAHASGLIKRLPRLVSVQASGANPFYLSFAGGFKERRKVAAETVATAIRIGDPVNHPKAVNAIKGTAGLVVQVSDEDIMAAKREIDRSGIGCEPASAATLAAVRQLTANKVIKKSDDVVCILTGHMLKDPDAVLSTHAKIPDIEPTLKALEQALRAAPC